MGHRVTPPGLTLGYAFVSPLGRLEKVRLLAPVHPRQERTNLFADF
jgi:hypothetical protein